MKSYTGDRVARHLKLTMSALILALLGLGLALDKSAAVQESSTDRDVGRRGYVLKEGEGEEVLGGEIIIKASPKTGSARGAMFSQTLAPKGAIPIHYHGRVDEFFFVHKGTGTAVVGEDRIAIGPGDAIFVPQGLEHKIENLESDDDLELVYFVSKPGLDDFFREVQKRIQSDPKPMTLGEVNEIAARHGDLYREWVSDPSENAK